MSRAERNANLGAVSVPFLGFVGALVLLWNRLVGWSDLAILAAKSSRQASREPRTDRDGQGRESSF